MSKLCHFSADRPLLLVADYPADTEGGGAVILRSLLPQSNPGQVIWTSLADPGRSLSMDIIFRSQSLARRVLGEAKQRNAAALWIILHGAGVPVTSRLSRMTRLPIHVTVHDDPAFAIALRSRRYVCLIPWIEHHFARTMRAAKSIDVVSQPMADRYRARYGRESLVVHRAMDHTIQPSDWQRTRDGFTVGVLGNVYGYRQLPPLARAIAAAAKQAGVRGRILVLGRSYGERLARDVGNIIDVDVAGHVNEPDAIARLRRCMALYLNYPFGFRDGVLRRTSFPTKLTTYLTAARPLIVHAPSDSSVSCIGGINGFVTHWHNVDPQAGSTALTRLWNNPVTDASFHEPADQLRLTHFDAHRNRQTLYAALDALPV